MSEPASPAPPQMTLGALLRQWRTRMGASQLDLALDVGVSTRHLSYIESGKARPSEPMLYALCVALAVPETERNALRLAAGFNPKPDATPPSPERRGQVRRVIEQVKQAHASVPLLVKDHIWDVVDATALARDFIADLTGHDLFEKEAFVNVLELVFAPEGLRPHLDNWDSVADATIRHVRHEAGLSGNNPAFQAVLERVSQMEGFAERWAAFDPGSSDDLSTRYVFRRNGRHETYDAVLMSLGAPYEAILNGIRFDVFYPASDRS